MLAPLVERGIDALACDDIVCIEWVSLQEVKLYFSGNAPELVTRRAIAELVATTSGLPVARVTVEGVVVLVGPVLVGSARLLVAFTTVTNEHRLTALTQELRDRHPDGTLLLLAPVAAPPTSSTARLLRMLEVELLLLADVVVADGECLVADLSAWALGPGSTLASLDPLPLLAYRCRLVLDPAKHRGRST